MFAAVSRLCRDKRRPKFQIELRLDRIEKFPFEDLELMAQWSLGKYKGQTHSAKVDMKQQAVWNEVFTLPSVKVFIDKTTCQPKEAKLSIVISHGKSFVGVLSFDIMMFLSAKTWQSERFLVRKTGSNCQVVVSIRTSQLQGTPLFHTRPDLLPRAVSPHDAKGSDGSDFSTNACIDSSLHISLLGLEPMGKDRYHWASKPSLLKEPEPTSDVDRCPHSKKASKSPVKSTCTDSIFGIVNTIMAESECPDADLEETQHNRFCTRLTSELIGRDSYQVNAI